MDEIKLPEPFGYISDFMHAGIRIMSFQYAPYDQWHSLYHSTREVYTAEQLRAAVEADRGRRLEASNRRTDRSCLHIAEHLGCCETCKRSADERR